MRPLQFLRHSLTYSALALMVAACAPENPMLEGRPVPIPPPPPPPKIVPPPAPKPITQEKPIEAQKPVRPKVDILFVVDNSDSMIDHQTKLKRNFQLFADQFEKNQRGSNIDFQIGVVTVWDREIGVDATGNPVKPERFSAENYYAHGKLRPLKMGANAKAEGAQFVTRQPSFGKVLAETLFVGTTNWKKGGPRFEESFSPVLAAIESKEEANKGFFRPDAHFAVVYVTDADDGSPNLSGSDLLNKLVEKKGGDRSMVSAYGVLALGSCKRDADLKDQQGRPLEPKLLMNFIKSAGGNYYSLCDANFGQNLSQIAGQIRERAMSRVIVPLEAVPELDTLRVFYGGHELQPQNHWVYDSRRRAVVINSLPTPKAGAEAEVKIEMIPVSID